MELNLHIIADDLLKYAPNYNSQLSIKEDYHIRRLRFPALFDGSKTHHNLLYIAQSKLLTEESIACINLKTSLIVIGRPPKSLLSKDVNLIWVDPETSLSELFAKVTELFNEYSLWFDSLQDVLVTRKRLNQLAELSIPIVRRSIYLVDSFLQTVFATSPSENVITADAFSALGTDVCTDATIDGIKTRDANKLLDNNNPALSALTIDRFSANANASETPFILADLNSHSTLLSKNIFLEGHLVATLSFGQKPDGSGNIGIKNDSKNNSKTDSRSNSKINSKNNNDCFTKRDYALLLILADVLKKAMTYKEEWNTSATQSVHKLVHILLSEQKPHLEVIDAALKTMAWQIDDAYYCVVAVAGNLYYPMGLLSASAKRVCAICPQTIYSIYEDKIVFIVNAEHSTLSQEETLDLIVQRLAHLELDFGVSNIFNGFWSLHDHYRLAIAAIEFGTKKSTAVSYHRFESHMMDYLIQKCRESTSLDSVIPRGLIQLRRYDQKYGTNLLNILKVYFKHDMRIALAAKELYLHRNTLTAKIAQIKFLTRMDFEADPEIRLSIMVALRMM
ncbi:MAG: helix-turn-helix domain-containing protein [Coriobacteriales bacterium]|jgi:hypothetical protein|nr:helix-turn-helix domain-containing protein [Coriobacteriales bacterium]